jgi:FkbM family methyltransferase
MSVVISFAKRAMSRVLPRSAIHSLRRYLGPYLMRRELEPAEFAILKALIEPGSLLIDVGANHGIYTYFFSLSAPPSCKIISIEPIASTFAVLQSNVNRLSLRNVEPIRCAASSEPRLVTFEIPDTSDGLEAHYLARVKYSDNTSPTGNEHQVEAKRLDDIATDAKLVVSLIKMDVEMHELEALRGAQRILADDCPALYIEIQPDLRFKHSQRDDIIALLKETGHSPYWYDHPELRHWTEADSPLDYFFLTDKHLARIRSAGIDVR